MALNKGDIITYNGSTWVNQPRVQAPFTIDITAAQTFTPPGSAALSVAADGTHDPLVLIAGSSTTDQPSLMILNGDIAGANSLTFARVGIDNNYINTSKQGDSAVRFSGDLLFGAGGTERLRFTNSGNVGIGVSGSTEAASRLTFVAATNAAGGILFGTDTNLYRSAADTLKTDDALRVGGSFTSGVVALIDAATIATDASLGNHFRVTLGGNRTLGNPTNPTDGQTITYEFIQDGTGSRTITLGSAFALGTTISSVTLTTTLNKRDFMTCVYNSTAAKWYVVDFVKGY